MDLDKNKFLGTSLGVQSIPTFLFIHKGQVVKKMSGADKNALTTNINWLITTYNLGSGTSNQINAQQAAPEPKTLQLYSEKNTPFYFDTEKWDLPIKKLKEYGTKQNIFEKPENKELDKHLVIQFGSVDEAGKKQVVDYCLSVMPVDNADDLVPFVDFIRICFMRDDLTK